MDEKKIKALLSLLDDTDQEIIDQIQSEILSIGDAMIPFLEDEWEKNFNPLVQERIEYLIHNLQFEHLLKALSDWKNSKEQNLLEGAWLVATYQYPDLELEAVVHELEQLYYDVWVEFKDEGSSKDKIKKLSDSFYNKLHFGANTKNFHSPANSMVNMVMESKKGNPITLCVIYLFLAKKLGLSVYGVNLPNLFVLTYKDKDEQFYINVFNKGLIFSKGDIDNYIQQLKLEPRAEFYEPCDSLSIVKRMLRNLVVSFEKLGDEEKVDEIRELLEVLSD